MDNLDARSDKHTIMDMCNQVFCPPLKFEFQPHMGDEVAYSPEGLQRCLAAWPGPAAASSSPPLINYFWLLIPLCCLHALLSVFPFLMRHLAH